MLTHSLFCPLSHFHPYYFKMVNPDTRKDEERCFQETVIDKPLHCPILQACRCFCSVLVPVLWSGYVKTSHTFCNPLFISLLGLLGSVSSGRMFPRETREPLSWSLSAYRPSVAKESRTRLQLWLNSGLLPNPHDGYWVLAAPQARSGQKSQPHRFCRWLEDGTAQSGFIQLSGYLGKSSVTSSVRKREVVARRGVAHVNPEGYSREGLLIRVSANFFLSL